MNNVNPGLLAAALLAAVILAQVGIASEFKQHHSKVLHQRAKGMMRSINEADKEKIKENETLATQAVQLNPLDGYANFQQGIALYLQKRYKEASEAFTESQRLLPHSFNALRMVAYASYSLNDFPAAAKLFSEYLDMNPVPTVTPELVYKMAAAAQINTQQLAEANQVLLKATELATDKAEVLHLRVMVSVLLNELWTASYCYSALKFHSPDKQLNPFELLNNVTAANKLPETIAFLQSLRESNPKDTGIIMGLAIAYNRSGQFEEAIKTMEAGLAADPKSADMELMLADILYDGKQYERAFQHYDKHLKLAPDSRFRQEVLQKKAAAPK